MCKAAKQWLRQKERDDCSWGSNSTTSKPATIPTEQRVRYLSSKRLLKDSRKRPPLEVSLKGKPKNTMRHLKHGDSMGVELEKSWGWDGSPHKQHVSTSCKRSVILRGAEMIHNEFKDREGEIISGIVRRFERRKHQCSTSERQKLHAWLQSSKSVVKPTEAAVMRDRSICVGG